MNRNKRGYTENGVKSIQKVFTNKFANSYVIVHPKFVLFFFNLRYLVKQRFKSFAAFSRELKESKGVNVSGKTVQGYESGYFVSVQFNWLCLIADFLGADANEMMMYNFKERDERKERERLEAGSI